MHKRNIFKGLALAGCFTLFLSGCAYRADLHQGNYVDQELVDSLNYGMTHEQVRYILGTPMLTDPFDTSRWYYSTLERKGWSSPVIKNLILLFEGDSLVDISGDFKKTTDFNKSASGATDNAIDYNLPVENNSGSKEVVETSKDAESTSDSNSNQQ